MLARSPVLIIGLGLSGQAAADFLLRRGVEVFGCDGNNTLLETNPRIQQLRDQGLKTLHESAVGDLSRFAYLVCSPGISPHHPLIRQAHAAQIEVIGEIELACRSLKGQRVLAITGTNGKTTVTLLVTHVLNGSGYPAKAVGNVGVALCSQLDSLENEILVMELSSFQIESLQCPVIDAAVVLNITPDHLDRHPDMDSYARAKLSIARCLKPGGRLWIQRQAAQQFHPLLEGIPYDTFGRLEDCEGVAIPSHDKENREAAWKLCEWMGVSEEQFHSACQTFKKPPHRIEFVRSHLGIRYIDDSKGTNIDAVIKAVASIEGQVLLIAGGVDKGSSYTPWLSSFRGKVKAIYVIGQAAAKIQQELGAVIPVEMATTLESAVKAAVEKGSRGDSVLLSPGCASFDMFRDYAHRGEEFQKIVWGLGDGEG